VAELSEREVVDEDSLSNPINANSFDILLTQSSLNIYSRGNDSGYSIFALEGGYTFV
jgi:hypothetical protein